MPRLRGETWWALASAAAMIVGAFGPWVKASAGFISISVSGTDGNNDGWLVVAAAVVGGAAIVVIVVMALDGFVRWRQWLLEDGQKLAVEITAYSDDGARALASQHEDLFRTADRTTVDARARELRKAVLLDVYERFTVEVANAHAARWVPVPEELRR